MHTYKKLTIVSLLLLFSLFVYSQKPEKGFQLYKQAKYTEAIAIFKKAISKKRGLLESKYGLALIYSDKNYKKRKYSRAYRHVVYLEKRYLKLTGSEKELLRNGFGLDDISIGKLRLKILDEALLEAKATGTIVSLDDFKLDFPNTEQSKIAILLRNKLAYKKAVEENNPQALIRFIEINPAIPESDSARTILSKFELKVYESIVEGGELDDILAFEKVYPTFKDKERLQKDKALANIAFRLDLDDAYNPNMHDYYIDYVKRAAPRELAFVALLRTLTPFLQEKDWKGAIKQLEQYKNLFQGDKRIHKLVKILETASETVFAQSLSNIINTDGQEYAPVLTTDGKTLYFCGREREGNIGGEDIFISKLQDSVWSKPKLLPAINTPYAHEAPLAISADGNRLLLYANTDIYFSDKQASGWSLPRPFPSINSVNSWEADAVMSADGNAILFISDKKGNIGSHHKFGELFHGSHNGNADIFVSVKNESGWSSPVNLGNTINTPYAERSPFLHPDMKTLYFSSDGHAGLGKLDVFKVERLNDSSWTEWSEPINLGKEINSFGNEYDYKISTNGKFAYLSSYKSGNYDILKMELPEKLRPDHVAIVSGFITNKKGDPISTTIKWEDLETANAIGFSQSDMEDGSYMIVLPLGKNYGYFIDDVNYYPLSGNIDLLDQQEQIEIRKDFVLYSYTQIINEKLPIPLENVFFEHNKYKLKPESFSELNRLITFIKKNPGMKVEIAGHTDNTGRAEYNQKLSQQRAKAVCEYLLSKGIDQPGLIAIGYGEAKPVQSNDTDEGKKKNRRVEFRVLEK